LGKVVVRVQYVGLYDLPAIIIALLPEAFGVVMQYDGAKGAEQKRKRNGKVKDHLP
jgi:hypothetical protein